MSTHVVNLKLRWASVGIAGNVYIGRRWRNLAASKWANPYSIGRDGTRAQVIAKYRDYLCSCPDLMAALPELRGKTLVCWCAPKPCHGDVLAELAGDA